MPAEGGNGSAEPVTGQGGEDGFGDDDPGKALNSGEGEPGQSGGTRRKLCPVAGKHEESVNMSVSAPV